MKIKNLTGNLLAGTAAAALLAAASAHAGTVVLNFEDLNAVAGGTGVLPSNYHGLSWDPSWNYFNFFQIPFTPESGTERIYSDGASAPFIDFGQQVTFNGSWVAGYALGGFWQGYQTQGGSEVLIDQSASIDSSGFGQTVGQFISLNWAGVDEVRFVGSAGFYSIDDVTFTTATAPDSGSGMLMLGSSIGALAFLRRRFVRA